ncbi:zinc ABC transporter substrate-binding protein [Sneathiella litorea]|uniref:High-affinity zinc uptake system protein ZnuA n=1 Tax=Sneathiella litorea TaxID=2606216 RepID=A0A6L8WAP2_9PROT|nr:zinc ABC transporter substrate-binding protein [Sneathiella litorea]MZR31553.1 zinc ABC transporter solute-binding protein [Sneathiella litorea]
MKKYLLMIGLILMLPARGYAAPTENVVVTIAPLYSLVQGVIGDTGEADLLLKGNVSPHTFQLKPSQVAKLQKAKIVFYIGKGMEVFLVRALETLPDSVTQVSMMDQPEMTILEIREGGEWEHHDHSAHNHGEEEHRDHSADDHDEEAHHDHDEHDHHGHEHEEMGDSHIWLDPANAIVMVKAITKELSKAYPENRAQYKENALEMISKIEASDKEANAVLEPVKDKPYVVFHDAYQYFENYYGLSAVGSIVVEPGDAASAKRIATLRKKIAETGAICVFREPQFSDKLSRLVTEETTAKLGTVDPIGAELAPGPDMYPQLLKQVALELVTCLND